MEGNRGIFVSVRPITDAERYKYEALFWMNAFICAGWRNVGFGFEEGHGNDVIQRMVSDAVDSRLASNFLRDDVVNLDGLSGDEVVAMHVRAQSAIPWSVARACCASLGVDADALRQRFWDDFESGLAENRALLGTESDQAAEEVEA